MIASAHSPPHVSVPYTDQCVQNLDMPLALLDRLVAQGHTLRYDIAACVGL